TMIGVETTLLHSSGEKAVYEPFFMQLEKGQKMNMAQSAGSIITYAKRYAVTSIFGISTGEDTDGVLAAAIDEHHGNQPRKTEDDRFFEDRTQVKERITKLAEKTGKKFGVLFDYVLEKANENLN